MRNESQPFVIDYQSVFDALPGMNLVLSPELTIIGASRSYLQAIQGRSEDLLGQHFSVVCPYRDPVRKAATVEKWTASLRYVLDHRQPHLLEPIRYDLPGADGGPDTEAYWQLSHFPVLDAQGQVQYILHEARDVTPAYLADKHIKEKEELFRLVSMATNDAIWDWNLQDNTIRWNENFKSLFGYGHSFTSVKAWTSFIHPEDSARVVSSRQRALAAGDHYWFDEYRFRCADGSYSDVTDRAYLLYGPEGQPSRMVGSIQDMTLEKEMQLQLQASLERFRFLAEAMPQKVWTALPDGHVNYLNQQWVDYTGYSFEQLKGHGLAEVFHPEDLPAVLKTWGQAIATGTGFQIEHRLAQAEGDYRWHLSRGLPMRNAAGEVVMWVGTDTDIHEQKLAQQELLAANRELQKTNEDLDRFVYTASHDLKQPIINLGAIFEELMRSCQFQDPDHEQLVFLFHKALDQVQATIADLAEIAKVQKDTQQEKEEIELQALTDEVLLSLLDQVKATGASIIADFAAIPRLFFSRVNLRSIFYNLISNAIKYRVPDRPPVVVLRTYRQDGFLVLAVQDNGLGINLEQNRHKLFQMFKRLHTHVPGTGLGLYIIHRIMHNNEGFVEVDSNLHAGSTFRIYFKQA
jgi:PAS domain S-box-containing protein